MDSNPSLGKCLPISLQHFLAMIVGNTLPSIVLAGTLASKHGFTDADKVNLIQAGMFIAAIATFLQLIPVLTVGAKLPLIIGVSFSYIPVLNEIGKNYGIEAVMGAQLVGAIAAFIVGMLIGKIRKFFPPIVSGTVVLTIGLSLYSVALNYMAGGNNVGRIAGQSDAVPFGNWRFWVVALVTLSVVLICNMFAKGYMKLAAILIGIVVGYAVALGFDTFLEPMKNADGQIIKMINFKTFTDSNWFDLPKLMPYKPSFPGAAVATMVVMFVVNAVQAVGDISSTTIGGLDREATDKEISGGIKANSVASAIGSLIGALPPATYSQNVGIVAMTKVVSLKVFKITGALILGAAFLPKFGALMLTVPQAVIGGATVSVFAQITMSGMKLITSEELSIRNSTIVGLGVALGMGITQISKAAFYTFPDWFSMIFVSSPVILATLVVFTLNLILPQKSLAEEQAERDEMEK
ncbi:uracil-xanthine permease family protein [Miniphocaeibacter massiliensis]|uniref:uracil-xanthine permease family protein n=1 Tax=Miniphocaeibacter massiliensis TaxID=2041841 RepID=UPI000C1C4AF7|nr:solute carrier family 23 protein [Miniphocaeibacter massiliensis]